MTMNLRIKIYLPWLISLIHQSFNKCAEDEKDVVHYDVTCDVCGTDQIVGVIYECMVCSGFDVCSQCKNVHTQEYPSHELQKVTESKPYHMSYGCDVCEVYPIGGVRYKCMVCHDYDLCRECKQSGHHSEHKMKEINKVASKLVL